MIARLTFASDNDDNFVHTLCLLTRNNAPLIGISVRPESAKVLCEPGKAGS